MFWDYINHLSQRQYGRTGTALMQSWRMLKTNVLALGVVCIMWDAHQQLALLLLGAFKRNVSPHSKWWDLTYGIKASLKPHLLQKKLRLSRDFQAEKVTLKIQKAKAYFFSLQTIKCSKEKIIAQIYLRKKKSAFAAYWFFKKCHVSATPRTYNKI